MTAPRPPYRIPPLAEIKALPRNGLVVASTFSGAGGSCCGYTWAGYRVAYANEFVESARASYAAAFPDTHLDGRDVRDVKGSEILAACGGEVDLLDGSPPCQPFSTAGKRSAKWGTVSQYSDANKQRADDLFMEFARLVSEVRPRAFVAENVSGLIKGVAKGYFKRVMQTLGDLGYRVEARLLDAQWLGVPQTRQRVIIVGLREDLDFFPTFPGPSGPPTTVGEALPWVGDVDSRPTGNFKQRPLRLDEPSPSVKTDGIGGGEIEAVVPFPSPLPWRYAIRDACPWIDRASYMTAGNYEPIPDATDQPSPTIMVGIGSQVNYHFQAVALGEGHPDGVDQVDREIKKLSATMLQKWLDLPIGGTHAEHFTLSRLDPEYPAPTVAAMWGGGGSGTGAPNQPLPPHHPRRFTILEVKRLCGFPDDYPLQGTYAERWARLGNSVAPPMARAVGAALAPVILASKGLPAPR